MLYLSHRIDSLLDFLAERLFDRGSDPFRKKWILIPSRINQQWLMASLAERNPGGAHLGMEILTWREALIRVSGSQVPGELALRLVLSEIFEREELPASFAPLTEWLEGGSERRAKLAQILSRRLSEAGFYGLESNKEWQQDLVRLLTVEGPWRFPDQLLDKARFPDVDVHCFCIDEMPKKAWDLLFKHRSTVSIYQFSPCSMYWEDLCSDRERRQLARKWRHASNFEEFEGYLKEAQPLLANWGKVGRQTIRYFEELESVEAYESEEGETLLHFLQQSLLHLAPVERDFQDSSIEIVLAGSSKLREVQILRERLFSYFKHSGADPADVLVLAPDIKQYEPLIQFVFGDEMSFRIAPIAALSSNLFLQGVLLFFDLVSGRWDADRVLELFENRAFQERHSLTGEDLQLFRGWMQDARIRGGWDGKQGNWPDGLRRLILGLVYLLPGQEIGNLDLGQADHLEKFLQIVETLRTLSVSFQGKKTLKEWAAHLSCVIESLFKSEDGEKDLLSTFLSKISATPVDASFSWPILRSLFEDACQSEAASYQAHLWQAVQFSSLQPGALRPAKALFLLGMESESFPRKRAAGSFDWKTSLSETADVDRYLLLQAIFAAKEHLSISYCHISPDDGKAVEMALPLQELVQTANLSVITPSLPSDRPFSEARPTPFWPRVPLTKEPLRFDVKDLALCAKNPWKFFLHKTLGIYLKKESLFSEMRREDFELPVYAKRDLLLASLHRPMAELLKDKSHLLPPGVFGEGVREKLEVEAREWKEKLSKWGIDPRQEESIRFSPRCKDVRALKEGWIEAPALRFKLDDNREVEIAGDLRGVAPSGLLLESSGTKFSLSLRNWPLLLVYLIHKDAKSSSLYSFESGGSVLWELDPLPALRRWILYFLRAKESLSPLIRPWAEPFLRKSFEEWSQKAEESLSQEDDRWIRWAAVRAAPLALEGIWHEWNPFLQETFQELLQLPLKV